MGDWTLFSNHGHVLLYLAGNTEARLRDVADQVGITERAVQKIVRELQQAGYLSVTKQGRCNRYRIHPRKTLRHPIEAHCTVAGLVQLVTRKAGIQRSRGSAGETAEAASDAPADRPAAAEPPGPASVTPAAGTGAGVAGTSAPPAASHGPKSKSKPRPRKADEEGSGALDKRQQGSLF